jgi:hypothetical protein
MQKFKNKFEDAAKIRRVEQLFERNSSFYQWRRTIQDAIRSVRDVSTSTEIRCKDIMLKISDHNEEKSTTSQICNDVPEPFWQI